MPSTPNTETAPSYVKISPALPVIWRSESCVHIGPLSGGQGSIVLKEVTPGIRRLIRSLTEGCPVRTLASLVDGWGIPPRTLRALLTVLQDVLITDSDLAARLPWTTQSHAIAHSATSDHLGVHALHGLSSKNAMFRRNNTPVSINNLGKTGLGIITHLASAGIRDFFTSDLSNISDIDVGSPGFSWHDIGKPRWLVCSQKLAATAPHARLSPTDGPTTQAPFELFTVHLSHHAHHPGHVTRLLSSDHPHLAVVLNIGTSEVGPLVQPGVGSCLNCIALHRREIDAETADDATRWALDITTGPEGTRRSTIENNALVALTVGLVVVHSLAFIDAADTQPSQLSEKTLSVDAAGTITEHLWPPHPQCLCAL